MRYPNLHPELLVDMLCKMLGTIHGAVLTACASEREHKTGEASLDISCYVGIGKLVNGIEEGEDFSVILKETDYWLIQACELLVRLVTSRVVSASAIEHVSAAVTAIILWNAFVERETEHLYHQRTLAIIF